MITIPTAEQQAFQGSSPKNLILDFPIGRQLTNENIYMESMSLEQSVCDESNLTFGMVYSSCFKVRIFDDGLSYNNLKINPKITVEEDGTTYSRNLGQFTVKSDKLTSDKIYRDLTCYDALSNILPFDYSQWHNQRPDTFTVKQYRDAFFSYIGITQASVTLPNDSVSLKKFKTDKVSGAQILSAILQINGAFGYIGSDGNFKYVFPKTTVDYTISDSSFVQGTFDYEDEPIKKISGVTIEGYSDDYGEEESYTIANVKAGDATDSMVTLGDNYLIHACSQSTRQTICNNLYNKIKNFQYYPAEVQFPVYIGLELGDVFEIVTERKTVTFPVFKRTLTGISALKDTLQAQGESEITSNANSVSSSAETAQMAINQMRLSVSELLAKKISVEELNADRARITTLETNYVTVNDTLTAHQANIESLNADKANITDLNAATARITTLETGYAHITELDADYANIKTLLSGNAGVGDLQNIHLTSANAVIDEAVIKNLVGQFITVNDLVSGTINTSKFTIASPDGAIKIEDSTQTFKDANGNVRIQMGQDASGNFTFVLYDETGSGVLLDSTGIKESAIADGLIKDAKVATDAGIKGSKLDIDSVVTELNKDGTSVLKSSKIWFDDKNQTLNQVYQQISTDISGATDSASNALAEASSARDVANAANENAQIAIKALEGITSLDNLTMTLTNDAHTIHTNYDGSGGSYTGALTQIYIYKGDTDVTQHSQIDVVSEVNVVGTWNASTRTYTVTELTENDGYVDFSGSYGVQTGYLYMPDAKRLVMPDGKVLKLNTEAAVVYKRFSLSKSPDGRAGQSFNLVCDTLAIKRDKSGLLSPSSILFSAMYSDGVSTQGYMGKFKIEESNDGSTWSQRYYSQSLESDKLWNPTSTTTFIRCTLYDDDGTMLDIQNVVIVADSEELVSDLNQAVEAIQTNRQNISKVTTSVEGLGVDLADITEELHGLSDGTLLFQTPYEIDGNTAHFEAKLYRAGVDVHTDYLPIFYSWYKRDENNDRQRLGYGYTMDVDITTVEYNGAVGCVFSYLKEGLLVLPDSNYLKFPDGKRLMTYAE